jgi:hypothetical protein
MWRRRMWTWMVISISAAASYYADFVTLYLNNGDGTFGPQQVLAENRNGVSERASPIWTWMGNRT